MKKSTASSSKTLNSMPSFDSSTSVEDLWLSFSNLCTRTGQFENYGAGTYMGNSSLALAANGSLTRTQQVGVAVDPRYEACVENSMVYPSSLYYGSIWSDRSWNNAGSTMSMNSGFGAPSTSNWAAPFGIMSQSSSGNPRNSGGLLNQHDLNDAALYEKIYLETLQGCDIIGKAVNQRDSRYLQRILSLNDPEITSKVFEGVIEFIFKVMTDQYGHHLFMKLIETCNASQLGMIIAKITFQRRLFFETSIDRYGSNSIKKLIKVIEKSPPLISEVVSTLCSLFNGLMTNKRGSYVILKCLDTFDTKKNELLYLEAIKHCIELAKDEKGCISLNNFISRMKGPRRDQVLDLISQQSVCLSQDQSGNYVVQHVLGLHNPIFSEKICYQLKGHYTRLSLQKGSSHVVETCIESPGIAHVIDDFLTSNQLVQVARDQYGNYVIQKALNVTKKVNRPFHRDLVMKFEPHLDYLKVGFGRNVYNLVINEIAAYKAAGCSYS